MASEADSRWIRFVASVFETHYAENALAANAKRRVDYEGLPMGHKAVLPDYSSLLNDIDTRIQQNGDTLKALAAQATTFLLPEEGKADEAMSDNAEPKAAGDGDCERARSILRQIAREWAIEGKPERDTSFQPLLNELQRLADSDFRDSKRSDLHVLIPGAGLGRLVWEVANAGFTAIGNECSMYMLLAGNAILNDSRQDQHTCFPFIHSLSNVETADDILAPVTFPDVDPNHLEVPGGSMSISAGDFVEVFSRPEYEGAFNFIVTAFFIDTASNVCSYIVLLFLSPRLPLLQLAQDTIRHSLAPHGIWINQGPLLWHHENSKEGSTSIELTLDDVLALCRNMGFEIQDQRTIESRYTGNPRSMLRYIYHTKFWVARKAPTTP